MNEPEDGVLEGKTGVREAEAMGKPIGAVGRVGRGGRGGNGGRGVGGCGAHEGKEAELRGILEDDGTFDFVGELADVAWPCVGGEAALAGGGDGACREALPLGDALDEMLCKAEDVGPAFAEGLDGDPVKVEPVVEVLAEASLGDLAAEVAVGCGDDAGIDGDLVVAADASDAVFLDGGEELALEWQGQGVDFVEEEGATGGGLEQADASGSRVREGALFVAEELGFREGIWDGGAIGLDEGLGGAGALLVEPASERGLAGSGFAEEEDRWEVGPEAAVGEEDPVELGMEGAEGVAEEEVEVWGGGGVAMFLGAGGLAGAAAACEGQGEGLGFEGLGEVVDGAELDGLDGTLDAGLGCHDDDAGTGSEGFLLQEIGAEAVGEVNVEENEVEASLRGVSSGGGEGVCGGDVRAEAFEGGDDVATEEGFVIDDEDGEAGEGGGRHGVRIGQGDAERRGWNGRGEVRAGVISGRGVGVRPGAGPLPNERLSRRRTAVHAGGR